MLLGRTRRASIEQRVLHLERVIEQQGYCLVIMVFVLVLCTITVGVLFQERGKPDFDHIAVALTIFQTLFGIAALYGFWALRGLTRDKAEEVAEEIASQVAKVAAQEIAAKAAAEAAERIAAEEIRELAPPLILRQVNTLMETFRNERTISDDELVRMIASLGGKEEKHGQ